MGTTPGLENFWYAVEHAHALKDRPVSVTLLGRRYLLFRDAAGLAHGLADYCAHRGASLGLGWIEGSCVRCPYHGWSYDTEGHCVRIPADPPGTPIPARARMRSFPVREQSGFIWIFPGEAQRAADVPIPPFPELDQPGWRAVSGHYSWNAHFSRVVESGLDTSHAPFVHRPFFSNREEASVESLDILSEPDRVSTHHKVKPPKRVGLLKYIVKKQRSHSSATLTGYLPNVNRIALDFNWKGFQYIYFASNIPVDNNTTLTKWIGVRNFLPYRWADGNSIRNTVDTYEEDRAVVETQPRGPSWTSQGDELLLASDQLILAYRRALARACPAASGMAAR